MTPPRRVEKRPGKRARKSAAATETKRGGGVLFRLVLKTIPEAADVAGALLVEEGAGGAIQDELPHVARITCFGESRAELERLCSAVTDRLRQGGIRAKTRVGRAPARYDGWRTEWTEQLAAVRISDSLWLAPTNTPPPAAGDAAVVWLEPALAFGFGDHPTTRMAALEVEMRCRAGARTVLDFGSGSGVLSLVALRSGARRATGLDVDAESVSAARRNATRNGLERRSRFSGATLGRLRSTFDLVVANVDRGTLIDQAEALAARVSPGGVLLLTGFLSGDVRDISRAYRAPRGPGFTVRKRAHEGDWALLSLLRH